MIILLLSCYCVQLVLRWEWMILCYLYTIVYYFVLYKFCCRWHFPVKLPVVSSTLVGCTSAQSECRLTYCRSEKSLKKTSRSFFQIVIVCRILDFLLYFLCHPPSKPNCYSFVSESDILLLPLSRPFSAIWSLWLHNLVLFGVRPSSRL